METSELFAIAKDIFVGLSAFLATIFAYLGLTTWRKELKGKSEYQLAKEVLKSVYKVREAFKQVRNPAIFQNDYPEEMLDINGSLKTEFEYSGTAHVYEKRWEIMNQAFRELEEYHLEAQVEWGAEFQNVILPLRSCKGDLLVTIQQMLDRKKNPEHFVPTNAIEKAEERSVLYYHGYSVKKDKFSLEIDEAINQFEKWLRPKIKR